MEAGIIEQRIAVVKGLLLIILEVGRSVGRVIECWPVGFQSKGNNVLHDVWVDSESLAGVQALLKPSRQIVDGFLRILRFSVGFF